MARRSGLGKGLGALIPTSEMVGDDATQLREIPVGQISPNPHQPRSIFDEDALVALTASIEATGVLQPILVRQTAPDAYDLIAGERRWRAATRAGLTTVPALVRDADALRSLEEALVENLHREDLGALEEAAAFQRLVMEFGLTQDQVATRVGKSRSAVANTIRLLQLSLDVQRLLVEGKLSAGHARALLGSTDHALQEELAALVVAQGLSVRDTEEHVRTRLQPAVGKPPPAGTESASLGPAARPTGASGRPAAVLELEELLADHLDTRVHVRMQASSRGRIVIEFATIEDLERVYRVILEGRETLPE